MNEDAATQINAHNKFGELLKSKDPKVEQFVGLIDTGLDILCYNYCSLGSPKAVADPKTFLGEMQYMLASIMGDSSPNDSTVGIVRQIISDMAIQRMANQVDKRVAELVENISKNDSKSQGEEKPA